MPVDRAGPAYAELALLRGDPSDGLPGVPGVGEKTAATLLAQHGSLEDDPGRRRTIRNRRCPRRTGRSCWPPPTTSRPPGRWSGRDRRRPSSLSTPSDALPLAAEHPRKVAKLAEQYGVTSSIGRLQKALDAPADATLAYLGRPTS